MIMPWCMRVVWIETIVVSWPPCWVAVEVKALPTLPTSAPLHPERPGLVPEIAHLRGHVAEAGRRADDDRVIVAKLVGIGERRVLVELDAGAAADLLGHQLGDALHDDLGALDLARAFGDGRGHRLDMAVARIIENQDPRHVLLLGRVRSGRSTPRHSAAAAP